MKYLHTLGRMMTVCGVALLVLYGAARMHEFILYRVAMRQFAELKQQKTNRGQGNPESASPVQVAVSTPEFSSWSKQRVSQYKESLVADVQPPIAVLRVPKLNIEAPVLEGTDDLTLNRGVGRIEQTARPGEIGNIGIAGHRDGFFRGLRNIKIGERVALEAPSGTWTYVVDGLQIVNPSDVKILRSTSTPTLTLVTCYPFYFVGSAPQRFVVHATLASAGSPGQSVM